MANSNGQLKTTSMFEEIQSDKFAKFELDFKRIEKLVHETVNKLTFAMTIPKLVDNDFELVKLHLTENQLSLLEQVFTKYFPSESKWLSKKTNKYSKLACMQSLDKIEEYFNTYSTRAENLPQRDEYDFSNAIQLLYSNETIKLISKSYQTSISEAGFNFVRDMKLFLYSLVDKMKITPQQAEMKEAHLRKLCRHHLELTDEAHILEEEAIGQVRATKEKLETKLNDVLDMKTKSDMLMEDCRTFVQKSEAEANKIMIFNWKSSEHKQEILEGKVLKQMVDLEMLRKKYVEEEKELRTRKYKNEQHLIAFLEQYDKDMQKKQNELDAQIELVGLEMQQYDDLNEQFAEQDKFYNTVMKEKAEYEQRLFEAKIYELQCAAAARKIQRFYKNFKKLLRIAGKKDLLKMKKKRKKHMPFAHAVTAVDKFYRRENSETF